MPAARPAGETDTESVEGAVPDAEEMLNQDALAVAVHASVPVPPFAIWKLCDGGAAPPAFEVNCRLAGVTEMVEAPATIMPMVSVPVDATTLSVSRPVRLAGSFTEIAVLCHDVTLSAWPCSSPPEWPIPGIRCIATQSSRRSG